MPPFIADPFTGVTNSIRIDIDTKNDSIQTMEMLTNKIFVMINQKIFSMEIVNESKWIEKHISVQLNNEIKI